MNAMLRPGETQPHAASCSAAAGAPPMAGLPARAAVETETEVEEKIKEAFDKGWAIIVWNDPINLMTYVAYVFQIVLKMTKEVANRHMLEVHKKGKSVVGIETREQAEFLVHRLQSYGLQATMEVM